MIWIEFKPADTLFFRGAEPMVMGQDHSSTMIFPPMPETLVGALRTLVLKQNNISIEDYYSGKVDSRFYEKIGRAGEPAPFSVTGPLFIKNEEVYVPAPFSYFSEEAIVKKALSGKNVKGNNCDVKYFHELNPSDIGAVTSNSGKTLNWIKSGAKKYSTIGGLWVSYNELIKSSGKLCNRAASRIDNPRSSNG